MKLLLSFLFIILSLYCEAQVILGGEIFYIRNAYYQLDSTSTYTIKVKLFVDCETIDGFRFSALDESGLFIYKGTNRQNAQLIGQKAIGGPIPVSSELDLVMKEYECEYLKDDEQCIKMVFLRTYRLDLAASPENYYFVYEGLSRYAPLTNIELGENEKIALSTTIPSYGEQRFIESYENEALELYGYSIAFLGNARNHHFCLGDTVTLGTPPGERRYVYFKYSFYHPRTDWKNDTPVRYKAGYSAEQPFGDNYFELTQDGLLKVHVEEEGNYLVGICATAYDKELDTLVNRKCHELTLQFYDCAPKVVAAIADATPNANNQYEIQSCDSLVNMQGRNYGQLSSGSFHWTFRGEDGTLYQDFSRNASIAFPTHGTYQGQLAVTSEGCTDSVQVAITIGEPPTSGLETFYEVCDFPFTLEGNPDVQFLWEDGSTDSRRTIASSGTYALTVTDNCERSQAIEVIDLEATRPAYGLIAKEDTTVCQQQAYTLEIQADDIAAIYWNGKAQPSIRVAESAYYEVEAITNTGCVLRDAIQVEVIDCSAKLYIPTAFSPNGDGVNDRFEVGMEQAEMLSIQIFNRWGVLVYEGTEAWDGYFQQQQLAEAGLYVYKIEYTAPLLHTIEQSVGELILMR